MKLFPAISAMKNDAIEEANAVNAYAQSPPPTVPAYVRIHAQCRDWYNKWFGIEWDFKVHLLQVQHALQGHPESGTLRPNLIEVHLKTLEFISAT